MKHYRVTGLTTDNRGFLVGELMYDHQDRTLKARSAECWGCGERRLLIDLESIQFDNGIADEEAFYCKDNEACQRKSGTLKRWIR